MILQSYLQILFVFFTDTESELTLYSGILFLVEEMKVKDTLHLYYLYVSIDFLGSRQNLLEMIIFFSDSVVPVVICLILEKGLAAVSVA